MAGQRWKGSNLLEVAAAEGMDRAAVVVEVFAVGRTWAMLAMLEKKDHLRERSADEELSFEQLSPLCVLEEGASLEEREVPWTIWRM